MSIKKWLVACGIVGLLVLSYFWGGNVPKSSDRTAVSSVVKPSDLIESGTKQQPEESEHAVPQADPQSAHQEQLSSEKHPEEEKKAITEPKHENTQEAKLQEPANTTDAEKTNAAEKAKASNSPAAASKAKDVKEAADGKKGKSDQVPAAAKKPEAKKDKYLTDPVPTGKPKPVEWQDVTVDKKKKHTATLSVSSKTILDHLDDFNPDKLEMLPEDGVIYPAQKVTFYEGESVFDVLLREMRKNKIHMEFSMTPIYNSNYIEGIHNIYEFDCGELSGWMYKVNGWFPNYGASRYMLQEGDVIEWVYTCDLGRDVGGDTAAGGGKG
ncbi:DUF4430 domain-containing protein [Paenibacillus guangzhouensis]|uniref:DUF4430 domain-containing protein n=1 Tax=Paenibacillus guangzhouensis TaxID=1473112 RepID=UPI001266DE15|nr:DUF4430 domain-containing protein [Paenibacillus guangzhouensis]